jgi:hypothetical protein
MANLKGKLVQVGSVIIHSDAYKSFQVLASACKAKVSVDLTMKSGYMSTPALLDELRKLIKSQATTPNDIKPLLDKNKKIEDIAKDAKSYDALKKYIETLKPEDYNPPLPGNIVSTEGNDVKQFPRNVNEDPRRTARLVHIGDSLKATKVREWILNNAVLYGFVPYLNNSLYYAGSDKLKQIAKTAGDAGIKKIIRQYMEPASVSGINITITAKEVMDFVPPPPPPAVTNSATPGSGQAVGTGGGKVVASGVGFPKVEKDVNFAAKFTSGILPPAQHPDGSYVVSKREGDRAYLSNNPSYMNMLVAVQVPLANGSSQSVKVHPEFAQFLNAAFADIKSKGLQKYIKSCEGAVCVRNVTGGTRLSHHSYGMALDINASLYPYGDTRFYNKTPTSEQDQGFMQVAQVMNNHGIGWMWSKDPMHFSIHESTKMRF